MSDLEKRVKDSFESMQPSDELNRKTLERIEAMRTAQENVPAPSPAPLKRKSPLRFALAGAAACIVFALVGMSAIDLHGASQEAGDSLSAGAFTYPVEGQIPSGEGEQSATDYYGGSEERQEPTAYLTLDINPSIEFELNAADEVIAIRGLNEDGKCLLAESSLIDVPFCGMGVRQALDLLTANEDFAAYVEEGSYLALSVTCPYEEQRNRLLKEGEDYLLTLPCKGSCRAFTPEERAEALGSGMGVQRYRAALRLIELDDSLSLDDCASMSMREMRFRIAELEAA